MSIALFKFSTYNVGDDIQSLALELLLARLGKRVDLWIDRDNLAPARKWGPDVRLIAAGWLGAEMQVWPLETPARVLWLGVHTVGPGYVPRAPLVGCRDAWSLELCRRAEVEAWISGCVTLTLPSSGAPRNAGPVLVEVPEAVRQTLPKAIAVGRRVTHNVQRDADRRGEAERRLDLYARATWVVTTRIHAFLPCVAMGTPVVFLRKPDSERRSLGYRHLAWPLDQAPWDDPRPRVPVEVVASATFPLRHAVTEFLRS